jgi:hypothetical protein
MIHEIRSVDNPFASSPDSELLRSKRHLGSLIGSLALFTLAVVSYLKAVPHDVGRNFGLAVFLAGIVEFLIGTISYEVEFQKRERIVTVRWMFEGVRFYCKDYSYDDAKLCIRYVARISSGVHAGCVEPKEPWCALKAGRGTYLFDRRLGQRISGRDLFSLKRELGFE